MAAENDQFGKVIDDTNSAKNRFRHVGLLFERKSQLLQLVDIRSKFDVIRHGNTVVLDGLRLWENRLRKQFPAKSQSGRFHETKATDRRRLKLLPHFSERTTKASIIHGRCLIGTRCTADGFVDRECGRQ